MRRWVGSLRVRLLLGTLVALAVALLLAGMVLGGLFREHVMRQFETTLTQQLDQLTARLVFDAAGQPQIDPQALSDPRWQRPFSGLYWQLDRLSDDGQSRSGVLRSRSLWDTSLALGVDTLTDGGIHRHEGIGPQDAPVLMLERTVRAGEAAGVQWRLIVAGGLQETTQAIERFRGVLTLSLLILLGLLALAALAQVVVGLAPLRAMQRGLADVRAGRAQRLQGDFPSEIQPLINDFNQVLDTNAEVVARARTHAGNLAHALKTPLAVMAQAASSPSADLAPLVKAQVALSRRHIDAHLSRSRIAAAVRQPGQRTPVAPVLAGLLRVMERVHAARALTFDLVPVDEALAFAGEEQDLQEMVGNLLDNACLWARSTVRVGVRRDGGQLVIGVDDDGPGISPEQRNAVLARGTRLDESAPGSGLGLAIVADLARLYGGDIALERSALGGLCARLSLPRCA
ncbi:MAG: sensor histidine kinase [Hydrogenophaga sp.]|uniref:sensor histidine kinase n=1 Tax=Hydrogenophaga sp. TaxID=1904254 RepID=UPI002619098B|nr:sensor histidine kinase [Hydrogenophaga sp.]MDM7942004.1 sensor histidine kinase [Hydrogenophaga sp.]